MTTRRSFGRRLTALGLGLLVAGCAGAGPAEIEGVEGELERARQRWEAAGLADYRWTVTRNCFCIDESRGPAVVTVRDGAVTAVETVDGGRPVDPMYRDLFPSVEGLFAVIEDALARGAATVDVRFDAGSGVPLHVWIDYDEMMADEEQGFEATVPGPLAGG